MRRFVRVDRAFSHRPLRLEMEIVSRAGLLQVDQLQPFGRGVDERTQ